MTRTVTREQRARENKRYGTQVTIAGVTPGIPGSFDPATSTLPHNLTHLRALGALGEAAAWTAGQYVRLANGTTAHWDGDSWEAGAKP
jgi:hypothetical protein